MANLAQRPGTFRAVALAVVLAVGIGCTASAQNPVTETETMKQLNTTTYWLGNNFGSAAQDGFERGHVHMKMCVNDIFRTGTRTSTRPRIATRSITPSQRRAAHDRQAGGLRPTRSTR